MAIAVYMYNGIAYLECVTVYSDTVLNIEIASVVEKREYVRTSYSTDIICTERLCFFLYEIIILIIVTDFFLN